MVDIVTIAVAVGASLVATRLYLHRRFAASGARRTPESREQPHCTVCDAPFQTQQDAREHVKDVHNAGSNAMADTIIEFRSVPQ